MKNILFALTPTVFLLLLFGGTEYYFAATETPEDIGRWKEVAQLLIDMGEGFDDAVEPHPTRFWHFKPDRSYPDDNDGPWKGFVSNAFRLRNRRMTLEKPEGVYRILLIGDSTAFGYGLTYEQNWAYTLEQMYRLEGRNLEIVNAAVPGYTTYQGLDVMDAEVRRLSPDLVLIDMGNNDGWPWGNRTDREYGFRYGIQGILAKSAIFRAFKRYTAEEEEMNADWSADVFANETIGVSPQRPDWVNRVPLDHYRENLDAFADMAEQSGVDIAFMIWPWQKQLLGIEYPRRDYQSITRAVATSRQIPLIDLPAYFHQSDAVLNGEVASLYMDHLHLNPAGATLAAEACHAALTNIIP